MRAARDCAASALQVLRGACGLACLPQHPRARCAPSLSLHGHPVLTSRGRLQVLLAGCGQASLARYHQGALCRPATVASLAVAAALTAVMYRRWQATARFMPAGAVSLLSGAMVLFYVWNLACVGPPPRPPLRAR